MPVGVFITTAGRSLIPWCAWLSGPSSCIRERADSDALWPVPRSPRYLSFPGGLLWLMRTQT